MGKILEIVNKTKNGWLNLDDSKHTQLIKNRIDYYLSHLGNSEIALLQTIMDHCKDDNLFGQLFCEALRKK